MSLGVVDLGATKTVIGSNNVKDLLDNLHPNIKKVIYRCPCQITFRFGNHGTLQSDVALVVPIHGFHLKVAIVPGSTPFLLSNTLLRALESIIDTQEKMLISKKLNMSFPLQLTSKGLFLLDLNDLASVESSRTPMDRVAETNVVVEPKEMLPSCQPISIVSKDKTLLGDRGENTDPTLQVQEHFEEHIPEISSSQVQDKVQFARSFQLPDRCPQHVVGQPSSESPGPGRRTRTRFQQNVDGSTREREDHLRNCPQGTHLSRSLGDRSELDPVVQSTLWKLKEGSPSPISGLRGTHGREGRAHSGVHHCHGAQQDASDADNTPQFRGSWEALPKECSQIPSSAERLGRDRSRPLQPVRHGGISRRTSEPRCEPSRNQDAELRKCPVQSDSPLGDHGHSKRGHQVESWAASEDQLLLGAGELSPDNEESVANLERCYEGKVFRKLLLQYTKEFDDIRLISKGKISHRPTKLFEVFCGPNSQLSHQCQRLGFTAVRFGTEQCDLQTFEGRRFLFEQLLLQLEPSHLWFSPTCGPWSAWSRYNETKSPELWENIQSQRIDGLKQIALGIALLRYQREVGKHFHWEQPKTSMMFRLPYLSEAFYHLLNVDIDLCVAGELKDPESGKLMKKGLTILTTSQELINHLKGLRCTGNHEHQPIEGSVKVNGASMNRSRFSEHYPRKFARRVIQCLCKIKSSPEKPYQAQELTLAGTDEPAAKKSRVSRERSKVVRVSDTIDDDNPKRIRLIGKTKPIPSSQDWKDLFAKVNTVAPRVGKVEVQDRQTVRTLQTLLPGPGKDIRQVIVCRGASRTIAPPKEILPGEAPWRINVFSDRETGEFMIDSDWENWENLSKRQLARPYHACRLLITIFARNPVESAASDVPTTSLPSSELRTQDSIHPENSAGELDLKKSQLADLESVKQSESFRLLPRDEQIAIIRAHKNLGHPHPERLSTLLRQQGFRAAIAQAALEFRCSSCEAHSQPKLARPSTIKDELDFNDRISVDGLQWTNKEGKNFHMYHIIDWSTSFHAAIVAPNRTTEAFIDSCLTMWFSWAGAPGEMLVDAATEMNSEEFSHFVQSHNIKVVTISTEAHHQNGKVERHGAVLQQMLSKVEEDHPIKSYQDLKQVLWSCIQAKNACSRCLIKQQLKNNTSMMKIIDFWTPAKDHGM